MKVLGGIKGDQITQLTLPSGDALPRNPQQGEVFWLLVDEPIRNTVTPWHSRGIYYFNYGSWFRLNHDGRQTRSAVIGSQLVDIEVPIKPLQPPLLETSSLLTTVVISPSHSKSGIAGSATLWVEARADCQVLLTVWREQVMVGMVAQAVEAKKPTVLAVSFYDLPLTSFTGVVTAETLIAYELRLSADKVTTVCVNRGHDQLVYDTISAQTAFTVRESE